MCRFHLNTYVNGYIVSTVGEYWPGSDVCRLFVENRRRFPFLEINEGGKVVEKKRLTDEETDKLLALEGDYFEAMYLRIFGYEDLGLNRKYETMVFVAKKQEEEGANCCPWQATAGILDTEGYNDPREAYEGHLKLCKKYDKEKAPI
jgi:hypothetical protein